MNYGAIATRALQEDISFEEALRRMEREQRESCNTRYLHSLRKNDEPSALKRAFC